VTVTNCATCSAAGTGISGANGGNLKITNAIRALIHLSRLIRRER
jgi:hypothetical protein